MYFCESNLVEGHFFPRKLCISIDLISVATQNFVEGNDKILQAEFKRCMKLWAQYISAIQSVDLYQYLSNSETLLLLVNLQFYV